MPNEFRILIIDDNSEIHSDFLKVLTLNRPTNTMEALDREIFGEDSAPQEPPLPSFQIDTASQGQEGVKLIEEALKEGRPYALAFVDMRMPPGWDGIETIKHMWALDKDIQAVICTAYSDYTWEETVSELEITDNLLILKKPFDAVAVRQLTCALTKKWQLMRDARNYSQSLETGIKESTSSLRQSLSLIRATLDSSSDGIIAVDNSDIVINYNNKFVELWEIPQYILNSKSKSMALDHMLSKIKNSEDFLNKFNRTNQQLDILSQEKLRLKDGRVYEIYSQPYNTKSHI